MRRWQRVCLGAAGGLALAGVAAWHWQSQLIGLAAHSYFGWIAAREEAHGDLAKRREAVAGLQRMLLLEPIDDAYVPELFDLMTAVSTRVAAGSIDYAWAAYVCTSYERDLVRDRPGGAPRRTMREVEAAVHDYVEFYRLQKRPDVDGMRLRELAGDTDGTSFTVEEIEQAHREGRDLTRGE